MGHIFYAKAYQSAKQSFQHDSLLFDALYPWQRRHPQHFDIAQSPSYHCLNNDASLIVGASVGSPQVPVGE